ncbi:MAG TPA: hypothetical protein VH641_11250 [Streptosporangiaceae bacterium]|jgi:hypothetical protein
MSKYIFLYRGPATPMSDFTAAQAEEQLKAWGDWMSGVGSSLVDGGAPFGSRASVTDKGGEATPSDQNGYTIVEADSLDGAKALTKGHPFLAGGDGRFSIEIFELMPM